MSDLGQDLKTLVSKAKAYVAEQRRLHPKARVLTSVALSPKEEALLPALPLPASVTANADPDPKAPWASTMEEFEAQICGCKRCPLGATRKRFVFGEGDPKAKLVFFGAAPGAEEEAAGRPFAGETGKLLSKIIAAMGFRREDVYVMNSLKCRPAAGALKPEELGACRPFFERQLELIAPKAICALGAEATAALLGGEKDFKDMRGKFFEFKGMAVMPSYHPAELLRNEGLKRQAWEDMKALLKKIS